jgi:SAM-dependent methyltransferase
MDDQLTQSLAHGLSVTRFVELFEMGAMNTANTHLFSLAPFRFTSDDPDSPEYAHEVESHWRAISGRTHYDENVDEAFEFDPDEFLARPYPFSSNNPEEIGRYLGAVGWTIGTLRPTVGSRVLELGAGWGHLALAMAQSGCDVTAVDLNGPSVELLARRAGRLGVALHTVRASFLDYTSDDPLDLIVFFESLHHCSDVAGLLDRCVEMLGDGGRIAFLAEPVFDHFYCPWGVRLDGAAIFMTRHAGWRELGFQRSYFYRELNARGLSVAEHRLDAFGDYGRLLVATKRADGSTFAGALAPDEEATWDHRRTVTPARLAGERSVATLARADGPTQVLVSLVNLCDGHLSATVSVSDRAIECTLHAHERRTIVLDAQPADRRLVVRSSRASSVALDLDDVGVCVESVRRQTTTSPG